MRKYILALIFIIAAFVMGCSIQSGSNNNDNGGGGNGGEDIDPGDINWNDNDNSDNVTDPADFEGQIYYSDARSYTSTQLAYIDPRLISAEIVDIKQIQGAPIYYRYDASQGVLNYVAPSQDNRVIFTAKTKSNGNISFMLSGRGDTFYKGLDNDGDYECKEGDPEYEGIDCDQYWEGDVEISGIHNLNIWDTNTALSFKVKDISFTPDKIGVTINNQDVRDLFIKDGNFTITLNPEKRDEFISKANSDGQIILKIDASNDAKSMIPREIVLFIGNSSLSGTLVDSQGNPVLENTKHLPIIIYDRDNNRRFVTIADDKAHYIFTSIPAGTYFFESGDVKGRYIMMGSIDIAQGDNIEVKNHLQDNHAPQSALNIKSKVTIPSVQVIQGGKAAIYSSYIPQRNQVESPIDSRPGGCVKTDDDTYSVLSSGTDEQKCEDKIIPIKPKSKLVSVHVLVNTEEKLKDNETDYKYRDKWSFNITLDNYTTSEEGQIAQDFSKDDLGSKQISKEYEYCLDVSQLKGNKLNLKINLTSQNVGDPNNQTGIIAHVTPNCSKILDFGNYINPMVEFPVKYHWDNKTIEYKDKKIYFHDQRDGTLHNPASVVSLIEGKNKSVEENYKRFPIPVRIVYVNDDNKSSLINSSLDILYGDNKSYPLVKDDFLKTSGFTEVAKPDDNDSAFKNVPNVRIYHNDNFTFPIVPESIYKEISDLDDEVASKIQFQIHLVFENKKTKKHTDVFGYYHSMKNHSKFMPLFEMEEIYSKTFDDYAARRVVPGPLDNPRGGGGWATKSTLEWITLPENNLRIGDISCLHGLRYGNRRQLCLLGHSSHTSGKDLDVKYSNPIIGVGKIANNDKINKMTSKMTFDNISGIMTSLGITSPSESFNFGLKQYCYSSDNNTFFYPYKDKCQNKGEELLGYVTGTSDAMGIYNLSTLAYKVAPQIQNDLDNTDIDDNSTYNMFERLRDWIVTNRLLISYYRAKINKEFDNYIDNRTIIYTGTKLDMQSGDGHLIYPGHLTSDKTRFFNILTLGDFADDNKTLTGLPEWEDSDHKPAHHTHWHITLPPNHNNLGQ